MASVLKRWWPGWVVLLIWQAALAQDPEGFEQEEYLYQSIADDYEYLGFKLYAGKSAFHALLPKIIPYRFSAPNVLGIAQSVDLGPWLLFETGGEVGWHEAINNPLYCWDCNVSPFNGYTETAAVHFKYAVYSPSRYKNLWASISYERFVYEWRSGDVCLCPDVDGYLRNGKMELTGYFLGLQAESYFIHSKWVLAGSAISVRLPVYTERKFNLSQDSPGQDEKRYLPVFDVQLRFEI